MKVTDCCDPWPPKTSSAGSTTLQPSQPLTMRDGNGPAEAMLSVDDPECSRWSRIPDELVITVEDPTVIAGCGKCGTGRRLTTGVRLVSLSGHHGQKSAQAGAALD